jgi:hypothetical protein
LDNLNDSTEDWEADTESDMELDNGSEDAETTEQQNVSAAPKVLGLIQDIPRSKQKAEKVLMTVNVLETRRNMWIKT